MKTNRIAVCGQLLALGLMVAACDDGQDVDDAELADAEATEADAEDRGFCWYTATPPATDDSDSIIGADDEVESEDEANGGCDLHMFRVTAAAPADRVRTVHFYATTAVDLDEWSARIWQKSCAGNICAVNFSLSSVPLTYSPPYSIFINNGNDEVKFVGVLEGEITLPATNSIADIRAGMRAIDDNGNVVPVTITISE